MKKSVKEKVLIALMVLLVVGSIVGIFLLIHISGGRLTRNSSEELPLFVMFLIIYAASFLTIMIHIGVHELGHVIFGMLTGYTFLSYRFMSFGVYRKNGKWKGFRMHIPGTAGQALMEPPEIREGQKMPYFWYNIGGILMNLVVVAVSFLVSMFTTNRIVYIVMVLLGCTGYVLVLMNGIPYSKKGITDGCNIVQFYKHPDRLYNFYLQLSVVGSLSRGKTWKEFSPEEFESEKTPDSVFAMVPKLYEINTWYARKKFKQANKVLQQLLPYRDQVTKLYGNVITLEEMFQELIGENDPQKVERLYTKELRKFVKAMKYEASMWRIQMAYAWFHEQDEVATLVCYEKIKKIREETMLPGDVELELSLAEYIKKRMEQTDVLHFE